MTVAALSLGLHASTPKFFQADTQAAFLRGDVENLSIDVNGQLVLGPATELVYETSAPFLWSMLAVNDGAVATSSVRRRQWQRGDRTVHHLIDPRTGEPGGPGLLSVTVAGPDPAWSEIWSTALYL